MTNAKKAGMTVAQAIAELSKYPPTAELRIAHQPHWPFEYEVRALIGGAELKPHSGSYADEAVWLIEGKLVGHFTIEAWRAVSKKKARR